MFFAFLCFVLAFVCRANPVLQKNEILHRPATLTNFGADKHHLNGIDVLVLSYNEAKARFSCIVASTGKRVSITVENLRHANTTLSRARRQESRTLASVGKTPPSEQTTDSSVHALVDSIMVWAADPKEFQSLMTKAGVVIVIASVADSDSNPILRDAMTATAMADSEPLQAYIDGFSQLLDTWSFNLNSTKRTTEELMVLNTGLVTIGVIANGGNQQGSEAFIESLEGVARTQALVNAGALEVTLRAMWMTKPNSFAKHQGLVIIMRLCFGHDGVEGFGSPEEATYRRQRAVEMGAIEVVADIVRSLANGKWKQQRKKEIAKPGHSVSGSELLETAMMTVTRVIIGNDKTAKARRFRIAATNIIKHAVGAVDKYYTYQGFKHVQHTVSNIMGTDQDDALYKRLDAKFQKEMANHPRLADRVQSDMLNDPRIPAAFKRAAMVPEVQSSRHKVYSRRNDRDFLKAVKKNDLANVEQLVAKGANINYSNKRGHTALILAVMGGHKDIVEFLLEEQADTEMQCKKMQHTALFYAATEGHTDILSVLLDAGGDKEKRNKVGMTVLATAALMGSTGMVKELLSRGSDINAITDCKTCLG
jgi:hypothetical protein